MSPNNYRIKGKCKAGFEIKMDFFSYITGITFYEDDGNKTLEEAVKGAQEAVRNRALDEKLRRTSFYRETILQLTGEVENAGRTMVDLIVNEQKKGEKKENLSKICYHGLSQFFTRMLTKFENIQEI